MSENSHPPESSDSPTKSDAQSSAQPTTEKGISARRAFLSGVAGIVGATGLSALAATNPTNDPKEVKNKILSRIQEQIDRDHVEDPMNYDRSVVAHGRYVGS
jgi:hypothetical protein